MYEQTQGHHHEQGHDPLLVLQVDRRSHKPGLLQKSEASLDPNLAFTAPQEILGGKGLLIELAHRKDKLVGRKDKKALFLQNLGLLFLGRHQRPGYKPLYPSGLFESVAFPTRRGGLFQRVAGSV